jgi:hypothetical protein
MYLYYTDTAMVANNEINIGGNASTTYGIYVYYPRKVSVVNNTVYTVKAGTSGTNQAHYNYMASGYSSTVRNNIFVAFGGSTTQAFYFNASASTFASYKANYNVDYNDYYSTGYIGYVAGSNRATLGDWKTAITPLDSHSMNILPVFTNPNVDLSLSSHFDTLICPRWQSVGMDIRKSPRPQTTLMGAYTNVSEGLDLMLTQFSGWDNTVVPNQTQSINVTLFNWGSIPITKTTFNWSVNDELQTPVPWTANTSLDSAQQDICYVGTFPISEDVATYDVVVWIDSVNGQRDTIKWNNIIQTSAFLSPIAEFVAPFVPDTITSLSFEVNTLIRSWTGATKATPKIHFAATNGGNLTTYDSVTMTYNGNNIWRAIIPPQYYGTKVVYSLSLMDTLGNSITLTDSTYIRETEFIFHDTVLLSLSLEDPLNTNLCVPDSTSVSISLTNEGMVDYNFLWDTVILELEITTPEQVKRTASIPFTGRIDAGKSAIVELISGFPLAQLGTYNIKVWINDPKGRIYKDTIDYAYVSDKISLPIDVDFSNSLPPEFNVYGNNTPATWTITGADTVVKPFFGDSMFSFTGEKGAMCSFATRHINLTNAKYPSLSFWYFHDTVVSKDYTEVRITVDGGLTYNTLVLITKYDTAYGWKQYDINLPSYAVNKCVIFVFEAMEKSNGNVTQYIDRIRITAQQDITISEIIPPDLTICNLQNKDVRIVLRNLTTPVLNYAATPTIVSLEVKETGELLTDTLKSGSLSSFAFDTITFAKKLNFDKGTYNLKAIFFSESDTVRQNDTLKTSISVNPELTIRIHPESGETVNCLAGEIIVKPSVTIYNTGNMDLSNIELVLRIDTGEVVSSTYIILKDICMNAILVGDSISYTFNSAYTVPWNIRYYVQVHAWLQCDSVLANMTKAITECVDMKDLYMVAIDNPSAGKDTIGKTVHVTTTLSNRSDYDEFTDAKITVVVTNSQGVETARFTETKTVSSLTTTSHTFAQSYTVPNDSVYFLTVYTDAYDGYSYNDTLTVPRYTTDSITTGIKSIGVTNVFVLGQNIPNPANGTTRIDYTVPEAGEVLFHVHSISGQLLYSKTIEVSRGNQSIELNTSTFAAGIYFYSTEYKGERIVKRMSVR